MKKFLIAFAIAGSLAACNNSGEGTGTGDSTNVDSSTTINNNVTVTPGADTMNMGSDTANRNMSDTSSRTDSTRR